MTEDQAREKWCPFAESVPEEPWESDRPMPSHYRCIASDCMAWRWVGSGPNFETMKMEKPKFGYCGLAGKP